jgi:CheY-like chemotaxis protein
MLEQEQLGKSILVAEDDTLTRRALDKLLSAAGYSVRSASNGREALDALSHNPLPDLIVLDLTMPVLDGWQFLQKQRQHPALASIPVVVVSGAAGSDQQAGTLDVEALLHKPIEFRQLLSTVESFVTQQKPEILIVDDEPSILNLLGVALRHHGFTAWIEEDGREAVEFYREHQEAIALVLLDVQMPFQDGPETLLALQQINPAVRCCFMSGNTGDYDPTSLLAIGADRIFQKPFALRELTRSLRQILAGETSQSQPKMRSVQFGVGEMCSTD